MASYFLGNRFQFSCPEMNYTPKIKKGKNPYGGCRQMDVGVSRGSMKKHLDKFKT